MGEIEFIPTSWKVKNAGTVERIADSIMSLTIDQVDQIDGSVLYAIRQGSRTCLNRKGEWECEPMNKDKRFLKRCRYQTLEEAMEHIRKIAAKNESCPRKPGASTRSAI